MDYVQSCDHQIQKLNCTNKMGDRKWEDLPLDCLVDIFARIGLESLVDGVPYVCKSWYKATLNPLCWQSLSFPGFLVEMDDDLVEKYVEFVIGRSDGSAIAVVFSNYFPATQRVLNCISEGCPSLKRLVLPSHGAMNESVNLPSVISKWKDLEALEIFKGFWLEKVIPEISVHCKKFVSLTVCLAKIRESEASTISTLLPNIEYLSLKASLIVRSSLVTILKGCTKLVHFDAGIWMGFGLDDELKNLASHITTLKFEAIHQDNINFSDSEYDSDSDSDYDQLRIWWS